MLDLETQENMRQHGFSEEMIAKCDNADKSKFRYEPPLDEFRKKMHELRWDDEYIDFTIKIAEDVAPLQDNIVWCIRRRVRATCTDFESQSAGRATLPDLRATSEK